MCIEQQTKDFRIKFKRKQCKNKDLLRKHDKNHIRILIEIKTLEKTTRSWLRLRRLRSKPTSCEPT